MTEEDTIPISLAFLSESEISSASSLPLLNFRMNESIQKKAHGILSGARNLDTLIIYDPIFIGKFQERVDGRLNPLHVLSNSLKRLHIGLDKGGELREFNLNAKNVVWLLVFVLRSSLQC